ncbi:MAG: hypothetical protein R6U46_14005 [Marinilabilia sp.]
MKNLKFAAHYMLSPGGRFLKWPVITLREDGLVTGVDLFPEGMREQAGVRFFSGILVPGFVDLFLQNEGFLAGADPRFFNRHLARGTMVFGVSEVPAILPAGNAWPLVVRTPDLPAGTPEAICGSTEPLWERVKTFALSEPTVPFSRLLTLITLESARVSGLSRAGALEPGLAPGLLLVQNADLTDLKPLTGSSVRWLNLPDPACFRARG